MMITKAILAAAMVAALSAPAFAQEQAFEMPAECHTTATADHAAMGHDTEDGDMMGSQDAEPADMPDHVQENMRRMRVTMPAMEQGMMNTDADVAFACGMIAHHQGAIDMAQVLVQYGDDPQMIALAKDIMAAQIGEIDQMRSWLAKNAE